jgi:hypothetical protein
MFFLLLIYLFFFFFANEKNALMLSPKLSWNDYFTGTPITILNSTEYSSTQTPSVSSVYVTNCLFNKCTLTSGHGGALSCTSVTYLFVESSSFFSCRSNSGQGGAIYFSNTNDGQSVLYAVCSNDCYSASYGSLARTYINNAALNKNYANYTSAVRCGTSSYGQTLRLESGNIYCPSINVSINKCSYISGIVCIPSIDSSYVTCSLLYSTFADNSASGHGCVWFNNGAKNEITSCNILRNTHSSSSYGIVLARGNLMIKDSCILGNTGTYIFYQEYSSYIITLSNCTTDSTSKSGSVITQNTVIKSFILGLHHMSTQNCNSEYDSVGTLTAIPHVSHSTNKVFCQTCKNHCQARMSDSFPLYCLFIFTFINSNPSGYC